MAKKFRKPLSASVVKTLKAKAKKSKLLPEIFHSDVLEHYIHAAEWEQKDYDLSVNDWQLRRYFERG